MFLKNIDMMCFDWTIFGGQVGSLKVTKVKYKSAIDPHIIFSLSDVEPFLNYNTMFNIKSMPMMTGIRKTMMPKNLSCAGRKIDMFPWQQEFPENSFNKVLAA